MVERLHRWRFFLVGSVLFRYHYILRSLYDNSCGGRCEQWRNKRRQWVIFVSQITSAARICFLQKDLRGAAWLGWDRFLRVVPVNIS